MKTNNITPPTWHGKELARRESFYQAGKLPVYDWTEVKARLAEHAQNLRESVSRKQWQ